ncbi:MAG TPA: ABC transporter ATP-binding protein [Planctomycetota bacterium]|nr:ABC transporter ATP-binding protein [Planctomycetota bacterium]
MADFAVKARKLGKKYRLYDRPGDRLRELLSFGRASYHHAFWALQDFDLEVRQGECIGVVGANGAGKSTLLKLLAGKLRPTTGECAVNGRVSSILELGTGFHPHLTGRQNARINALFMGQRPWQIEERVAKILEFAGIGEHADQPLATYSWGMQARLAFAALTTLDPELLLLDEALATGDAQFAAKCNAFLRQLCRSGCTTLVASHDFGFLATTCDRIVWIDKGRKRADGPPLEALASYMDALGQDTTGAASRPVNVLLRIEASEPAAQPTFLIHAFEWIDHAERVMSGCYVGEQDKWNALVDLAPKLGFTTESARAGWARAGEMFHNCLNRSCTPGSTQQGAAYVALPVPAAPWPLPTKLRVTMRKIEPCDAVFSLQVDGSYQEVGRAGRAGTDGEDWVRADLDVTAAFERSKVAATAGTGATP